MEISPRGSLFRKLDACARQHPVQVNGIVGDVKRVGDGIGLIRLLRGAAGPAMNQSVAVSKSKRRGADVFRSGQINPVTQIEFVQEVTVVDAVRMFFDKNENI